MVVPACEIAFIATPQVFATASTAVPEQVVALTAVPAAEQKTPHAKEEAEDSGIMLFPKVLDNTELPTPTAALAKAAFTMKFLLLPVADSKVDSQFSLLPMFPLLPLCGIDFLQKPLIFAESMVDSGQELLPFSSSVMIFCEIKPS